MLIWVFACGPQTVHPSDAGNQLGEGPSQCDLGAAVVDHGGPVLNAVEVDTLYWDGAVAVLQPQLDTFFAAVVQSTFLTWLSEYTPSGGPTVGVGTFNASLQLPNAPQPVGGVITDAVIQQELSSLDDQGMLSTNAQAVFFVFMPPATIIDPQSQSSNGSFDGYHNSYNNTGTHREIFYAVIPDPTHGAAQHGLSALDFTTVVASHELTEAITDPSSFDAAWYDDNLGEIGDICAWQFPVAHLTLGGTAYAVQRIWSQARKACVYQDGALGLSVCGQTCVDLTGDPDNCGSCGAACGEGLTCIASACGTAITNPDPCGADLTSDPSNCGSCGYVCPTATLCAGGNCVGCALTVCSNACVDLTSDLNNCNGCGTVCPSGDTCVQSTCTPCATTICSDTCVDTGSDPDNCNGCGNVCSSGSCAGGACQ